MISRRELLRRAGLAGLAVAPLAAVAKLLPEKTTKLLLDDKPIKQAKALSGIGKGQISIDGRVVGNILSFSGSRDNTRLDSTIMRYQEPDDCGEITIEYVGVSGHDYFMAGGNHLVTLMIDDTCFEFNAWIMSASVSSGIGDLITTNMAMKVGAVTVT